MQLFQFLSCLKSRNVLSENVLEPRVVDDYLLIYSLLIHLNATQTITVITGQPRNKATTNSSTQTSENLISTIVNNQREVHSDTNSGSSNALSELADQA